jgi:hypothetical protein
MIRGSGRRTAQGVLWVLYALASSAWGCAGSQFRLDSSAVKPRDDGAIRLSCVGTPRRFAVKSTGLLHGIGDIHLKCLPEAACIEQHQEGREALKIVNAGTWVEVSAKKAGKYAHSSGVVCLIRGPPLVGSCSDDGYVLDFIVDCPTSPAQPQKGNDPASSTEQSSTETPRAERCQNRF